MTLAEIVGQADLGSIVPRLIDAAAERRAWCENWQSLKGRLMISARPLTGEEPIYCDRWIAGSVLAVLSAGLDSHSALLPLATAQRLGVPPETLWRAAEANVTRWFYRRNWSLQGNDDPAHDDNVVLAMTDDESRSSGIVAVPALIEALARETGIAAPAFAVPVDGIFIFGRDNVTARRAIAARAGTVLRMTPPEIGVPAVSNEVFRLDNGRVVSAAIIH